MLSGVLWPLEHRTGSARDVISTAVVVLDHDRDEKVSYRYPERIVRFDEVGGTLRDCTRLPYATAVIESIPVTWDHRNQLTKVEFYNAPVKGTATLAKTVEYTRMTIPATGSTRR